MVRSHARSVAALALALVGVIGLAGCSGASDRSQGPEPPPGSDKVTVQLDFQVRGLHSMFYVGRQLGYFAEEGIDLEDIRTGTSSGETLRLVGQGQGDIGVADLPTLVLARSQNVPVKAIAAIGQRSPIAVCAKSDKFQLRTPQDLAGLRVGVQASGSTYVFYRALLSANGVDQASMRELTVNPPYENYLLTDQVDVVPCYLDAEYPILAQHAGGEGSISVLKGEDWGYDAYGTGLFASDSYIAQNPDLLQRFMRAYMRAFDYVVANPREAAQIVADSSPRLARNADLYTTQLQADIADSFFTDPASGPAGLGTMTDDKWRATIDLLAREGVISSVPSVDDVRDETFVDAARQ